MPMLPSARSTITSLTPFAVAPLEAGRLLSLGLSHVYSLMRSGKLENFHSGRARRITMRSIEKYVAQQLAAAKHGAPRRRGRPPVLRPAAPPKRQASKPMTPSKRRGARVDQTELEVG